MQEVCASRREAKVAVSQLRGQWAVQCGEAMEGNPMQLVSRSAEYRSRPRGVDPLPRVGESDPEGVVTLELKDVQDFVKLATE